MPRIAGVWALILRTSLLIGFLTLCIGGQAPAQGECMWTPQDPHKMHFPQLPDEAGWDVRATEPIVLADDWQCSETGWVKDIHFWGSWKDGIEGQIVSFILSIHADIPVGAPIGDTCFADGDADGDGLILTVADLAYLTNYLYSGGPAPDPWWRMDLNGDCQLDIQDEAVFNDFLTNGMSAFDPYGGYPVQTCCGTATYSRPGEILWERQVMEGQFEFFSIDPQTPEGWYDPETGETLFDNHIQYFMYNVCLDSIDWFWQEEGTIYWLNISAIIADPAATQWGWKSSIEHWNDDAVWARLGEYDWQELYEPQAGDLGDTNAFNIAIDPTGLFLGGGGQDAFGQGWYFYPEEDWWNIWFYDHPFADDRYKDFVVEFDVFPLDPGQPMFFELAVNWSTDIWTLEGNQDPPLPGVPEQLYIGRATLIATEFAEGHYIYTYRLPDYNPEWASIDVRGFNFDLNGVLIHTCKLLGPSMDMSFVITQTGDEPDTACCLPDGSCIYTTVTDCMQQGGFLPPGGVCLGDGNGNNIDDACEPPEEACCLQDGSCIMIDPVSCMNAGGNPQGPGSMCTASEACCMADGSCLDLDPLCCVDQGGLPQGAGTVCQPQEACCLPTGSCVMADPICCVNVLMGNPQGPGTICTQIEACCFPDATCADLDPLCCVDQGGIPQGVGTACSAQTIACCLPDGSCIDLDPLCCDDLGGVPSPTGAPACLGDGNGNNIDDACEGQQILGACCLPGGGCIVTTLVDCQNQLGVYQGDYTVCLGDANGNGVDDACEDPWTPEDGHKMHYPQLPDEMGWDVNATAPIVLADDWMCSETGWVKDVHFWGSWMHGITGRIESFILSIHLDIPANPPEVPYSRPGPVIWEREVTRFNPTPLDPPTPEGWYDPSQMLIFPDDHFNYFQYDIYLDSLDWFWQDEGTIYWLNISAILDPSIPGQWGWKSSIEHFNDDAVWAFLGEYFWVEMYEPPDFVQSLDLSFVITGGEEDTCANQFPGDVNGDGFIDISDVTFLISWLYTGGPNPPVPANADVNGDCCVDQEDIDYLTAFLTTGGPAPVACTCVNPFKCDCIPGDANGDGTINVGDAVYVINYVFKGGPGPVPYLLCSGDANCDCNLNVGDGVYLINYVFKGGPKPCYCCQWITACGQPLRK